MKQYWLSFADPDREPGTQFLGVSIIKAETFLDAVIKARRLGCNPGGEVLSYTLPDNITVPGDKFDRLMQRPELELLEVTFAAQLNALH